LRYLSGICLFLIIALTSLPLFAVAPVGSSLLSDAGKFHGKKIQRAYSSSHNGKTYTYIHSSSAWRLRTPSGVLQNLSSYYRKSAHSQYSANRQPQIDANTAHRQSVTPYGGHPSAGSNRQLQYNNAGTTAGAELLNYSGSRLGIGTTSPLALLHLSNTTPVGAALFIDSASYNNTTPPVVNLRGYRGTFTNPSSSKSGDGIGQFTFRGRHSTAFPAAKASVNAYASEDWTSTANGTRLTFETTAEGTTGRTEKLRVTGTGKVGIGTTTPTSFLTVISDLTTSAVNYVARLVNNVTTQFAQSLISFDFNSGTVASIGAVQNSSGRNSALVFNNMTGGSLREAMRITGNSVNMTVDNININTSSAAATRGFNVYQVNSGTQAGVATFNKSRGTFANLSSVKDGDAVGNFAFKGNYGGSYQTGANFLAAIDGTPSTGFMPMHLRFQTSAGAAAVERMRITPDGKIGIGTTSPRSTFDNASSVTGKARFTNGSATNYATISQDLGLRYAGKTTTYDDIRVEPNARTTGSKSPVFNVTDFVGGGATGSTGLYEFDDAIAANEKEVYFTLQTPHTYKENTAIGCHVHWIGRVNDTTAAPRWGLTYTWSNVGSAYPAAQTIYTTGINITGDGTTSADITAGTHYISTFADITPVAGQGGISSIVMGRLFRNSSDAADTYNAANASCGLLYIDCHIEVDSTGSDTQYGKQVTP